MPTIFTKIIQREIPAHIVAEDAAHIAFLDINPLREGHTLVIPKQEVDEFFSLSPEDLSALMRFAQRVARAMKTALSSLRIGLKVHGLDIPHAHIHLLPILSYENFKKEVSHKPSTKEMQQIAARIAVSFECGIGE